MLRFDSHDNFLTLERTASGDIAIVDCQYATSGGSLRDMVGALVAHFAPYDGPDGKIMKDAPNAERLIYDKRVLAGIKDYWKQGKYMETIRLWGKLSPELQSDRYPLLLAIGAGVAMYAEASQTGPTEFAKSFDESVSRLTQIYRKHYPGDATIDILMIDHHVQKQQFGAARDSIDAVDEWIGGDPYLDTVRAGLFLLQNDLKKARATAEKSLREGSEVAETYTILAAIASEQGDESRASELIKEATEKFGADLTSGIEAVENGGDKNLQE